MSHRELPLVHFVRREYQVELPANGFAMLLKRDLATVPEMATLVYADGDDHGNLTLTFRQDSLVSLAEVSRTLKLFETALEA